MQRTAYGVTWSCTSAVQFERTDFTVLIDYISAKRLVFICSGALSGQDPENPVCVWKQYDDVHCSKWHNCK